MSIQLHYLSNKKTAILNPIASLLFLLGKKNWMHRVLITKAARILLNKKYDKRQWMEAIKEAENGLYVPAKKSDNIRVGNGMDTLLGKWLYSSVRVLKPEIMIETGIAHGSSSWVILNALKKNGSGKLYSFDLPNNDTNKAYNFTEDNYTTGWIVPDQIRDQWEMIIGDSKKTLPEFLKKHKSIDYFFHDSDHSYEHMTFEFNTVKDALKKGGFISSDDINKNSSFQDFVKAEEWTAIAFNKGGSAVKS